MKKNYILSVITLFCSVFFSYGQMTDLIISEYCEGSSNNKYIEIYNGTGALVDLSNYQIWRVANGGVWPEVTFALSGTLADGATYVIANPSASATIIAASDITSTIMAHNGDDPVGLAFLGTLIDAVGTDGADPGTGWDVAGTTNGTLNHTLVRKDNVCAPNTNWTTSAGTTVANSEWVVLSQDDFSNIGTHTEFCSSTDTFVQFVNTTSSLSEGGLTIDVCVEITNPSATVATNVDIELDVSSTAINGTDYDDGAGTPMAIAFPVSLTFPAGSSTNQCLSIFISTDDLIYEGDETIVLNLTNPTGGTLASVGANNQHALTILDNETPVLADVIITEIMYNSIGVDDEWIEVCNTSSTTQVVSNYTIDVGGTTEFTFPSSYTIAAGDCVTIPLGDGGGAYNPGCVFVPTFTIPAGTGVLNNTTDTISIVADDGVTVADVVTYNDVNGADGNGASLHVTDDSLDNSNTGTNWQEVIDGGSPGFNTLISQCSPLEPEINVESGNSPFPNITNGAAASGLINTQFSTNIDIAGGSETRSYRIQNIGTADLNITNIEILGAHPGDFSITSPAVLNFTVGDVSTPSNVVVFEVTFDPTVVGTRNAIVSINNNDTTGGENPFQFNISGGGVCSTATNTVTPLSGPANTVVTISGSDLGGGTSVAYGGSSIPHTSISPTEIEITIPSGASTNSIVVTNDLGCQTTDIFNVTDNTIAGCEGSTGLNPTDLFISEVTDAPSGSHTYIEIFNGTGAAVNLDDYELRIHNNGSNNAAGDIADLTGILADGDTYVIGIGGGDAMDMEGGYTADDFFAISGINDNDNIRLYFNDGVTETWLDVWGDTNGNIFTVASAGYTYRRKNTGITVPRTDGWNGPGASDDMINDWDAITPVNYLNIGSFDFSTGAPPTVLSNPTPQASSCELSATFSVSALEGLPAGMFGLEYRWFVAAPGAVAFSQLTDGGVYSGANTSVLSISDTTGLEGYQYYCEVWEDTNSCFTASEAVRVITQSARWQSPGIWSNGTGPDINTVAFIDFDYTTGVDGPSFSACQLIVDTSAQLIISDNTYVEVDTDVTVDGNIIVRPYGSFVQIDDSGTVNVSSPNGVVVEKRTSILNSAQEYTYWSSPVSGETVGDGLNEANPNRRFIFNAQNYRDSLMENMNDNATDPGQDDIDDDGNDWQFVGGGSVMSPGVGYAATHSAAGFIGAGNSYVYTFEGPFNNGVYNVPVYRNDAEGSDNNWNFIGNPYPSAIAVDGVDGFFARNVYNLTTNPSGALEGAIYLWSHFTAADGNTNGNQVYNYSQGDYAIINGTGELDGNSGITPLRFIPSGQGFFVAMSDDTSPTTTVGVSERADVIFNNSMRLTGDNTQFFRTTNASENNKLKLLLSTDNGVYSPILIGYLAGASNDYDGMFYDAPRIIPNNTGAVLYSTIESSDKRFAIQGRATSSLNLNEIIPLGFNTTINEPAVYSIAIAEREGAFMTSNTVFIKDKFLEITHDLTESDYTFTSEIGDFTGRFEIVFQSETLSSGEPQLNPNDIKIIELSNGDVKITVGNNATIDTIEIIDLLGRTLYQLKGGSSTETYTLSALSQSAYLAKIRLSNGQTITKRAIKRH